MSGELFIFSAASPPPQQQLRNPFFLQLSRAKPLLYTHVWFCHFLFSLICIYLLTIVFWVPGSWHTGSVQYRLVWPAWVWTQQLTSHQPGWQNGQRKGLCPVGGAPSLRSFLGLLGKPWLKFSCTSDFIGYERELGQIWKGEEEERGGGNDVIAF